jgi:nicotinate-nucleotide adenylyltransferase
MKKIGLLGGTFDPPHTGHLLIAYEVLHALSLDEVWFIPTKIPPHKNNEKVTSPKHRLNMLSIVLKEHQNFSIQAMELEREGPSYTFHTIDMLNNHFVHDFYFIIGGDMIEYLPNWYKIDDLINMVKFVGVGRKGYTTQTKYPIIKVESPIFDISSSLIRKRVREKGNTEQLIHKGVKKYIEENHLYE